jgi:WD40 repeat protein
VRCSLAMSSGHAMTGNQFGQAKLWDLRTHDLCAAKTLDLQTNNTSLLTLGQHPGRTHLILGGCSDGNLSLWDLRAASAPVSFISRHEGPIWTLKFHPLAPIAVSGGADSKIFAQSGNWEEEFTEISAKDLSPDSLIDSINSLSLSGDHVAAGGDDCCLVVASLR